jgi:hypothetical protein
MDFWGTLLVYIRRWYLALPALLLSFAVAGAAYETIPTHYVSVSVLVLTTSTNGGTLPDNPQEQATRINPLLSYGQGLSMSAAILIQTLGSPETAAKVGAPVGGDTKYTISNGSTNPELLDSGPFVYVQADSPSPQTAQNLVLALSHEATVLLAERQRQLDAPPQTYVSVREVVPATTAQPQHESKLRAAAAALAIGFIMSLTAAFGGESFAQARRARRDGASEDRVDGRDGHGSGDVRASAAPEMPVRESAVRR